MGKISHSASYQGFQGTAFAFRWDAGLQPSSGWIDLNLDDMQKILIDVKPVPWGGNSYPGLISIKASELGARGTVAAAPGPNRPQGPGLANFGDLELKSFNGQATFHEPITYKNIFIAEGGIEEIERELARVRLHSEGKVRVQLSDVRMFYRKAGALLQRFNCRRPGGEWDQVTLRDGGGSSGSSGGSSSGGGNNYSGAGSGNQTVVAPQGGSGSSGKAYSLLEILRMFFKLLPGAPVIDNSSDVCKDQCEPPVDIVGEGEPIVDWIEKLLAQYGYQAYLQPDSQTYLIMKIGKKVPYGQIAVGAGSFQNVEDVHYERKTVWVKNRPPAVSVIGKRRVRRISLSYIPVFQSADDGMIYKLSALPGVYGYSMDKLNKQVMVGHEKNFRDVPPKGTAKAFRRGASLRKCAYRMYAPASAFPDGKDRITLQDLRRQPFMPMKKCPVYLDELNAWFGMTQDVEDSQNGDKGPFALVAPIVRGYRYGQGFFKDYGKIEEHFNSVMEFVARDLAWSERMEQWVQIRMDKPGLLKPQEVLERSYTNAGKYFSGFLVNALLKKFDEDLNNISKINAIVQKDQAAKEMLEEEILAGRAANQLELQNAKELVQQTRRWQDKVKQEFGKYKDAFAAGGGVQLKCQLPWGLIERGHYTINAETGILLFSEPACRLLQPFLMDNDAGTVYADGAVTVTFGYELNSNTPLDYTSVSFVAQESNPDDAPKVACVSLCYPLAMPSHVELASGMQLYEDQTGVPFNATATITEAASYAKSVLEVPHRVDGYTYELDGLRKATLEGGVNSVQHELDGNTGLAYTHVMVNSPIARGVIPGRVKDGWVASVHARRQIETSKEQ